MSNDIQNLEPREVWNYFHQMTQIPHPSEHEEKIRNFVLDWAKQHNLEVQTDEIGNVIVRKPASPGMENRKGIIMQGHLDMVPQKNSDTNFDFLTDSLQTYIDGEWVKAKGTTLGADNGMGCAAAMAILADNNLKHGLIEALFTIDEEQGMTGAFNLKSGYLKGDILLNLDSEDEGEMYVGCAGGMDANAAMSYREISVPAGMKAHKLAVTGLKGGHSGLEIILGRANANKLMNRFLMHAADKFGMMISSVEGGSLRNAIPRESFAVVVVPEPNSADFEKCLAHYEEIFINEYKGVDPEISFKATSVAMPSCLIDNEAAMRMYKAVAACPNGVIRMSDDMPGLVETSTNLAIVKSANGTIEFKCLLRSSVDSAKEELGYAVKSVFELAGASVELGGAYPGWKPNMESPILNTCREIYQKMYGNVPEIKAIHAGLECGILGATYPHWDMISFGPTIRFPHSPDEKVNIPSVKKFYDFLRQVVENAPVK